MPGKKVYIEQMSPTLIKAHMGLPMDINPIHLIYYVNPNSYEPSNGYKSQLFDSLCRSNPYGNSS